MKSFLYYSLLRINNLYNLSESGSSATTSSAAAHSDYVEDPQYMEVPHTDYNVAVAMMPIGAATGEGM